LVPVRWRVSDENVQQKVVETSTISAEIDLKKAAVILQLYDNSVYMVGGAGGTKHLPVKDQKGVYHVDGTQLVTDRAGIKELTGKLLSIFKALGSAKKLVLSPLACCWPDPCCEDLAHMENLRSQAF
jgi:hypothetical protein